MAASFPSSWIIANDSTDAAASTAKNILRPPASPSPRPAAFSTTPPLKPPCRPTASHDDPYALPCRLRRPSRHSCTHDATYPAALEPCTPMDHTSCCHEDVYPAHLIPPGSRNNYRDVLTATRVLPQQSPFTRPTPFPTHFPSTWVLETPSDQHSVADYSPRSYPDTQRLGSTLQHGVRRPSSLAHWDTNVDKLGNQTQPLIEHAAHPDLMAIEDVLSGRREAPSRHEEIDEWRQSLSQTWSDCSLGNDAPGTKRILSRVLERHPNSISTVSDDSGMGDAPHRGQDVPETYSVYAWSHR